MRKNDAFDAKIVNMRLTKIFIAIFAPYEKLPSSATLPPLSPGSINLTSMESMPGRTQLFEGAHSTDDSMHFCRESSKCPDYALCFGEIINCAL